jgi:hypothetical protein
MESNFLPVLGSMAIAPFIVFLPTAIAVPEAAESVVPDREPVLIMPETGRSFINSWDSLSVVSPALFLIPARYISAAFLCTAPIPSPINRNTYLAAASNRPHNTKIKSVATEITAVIQEFPPFILRKIRREILLPEFIIALSLLA